MINTMKTVTIDKKEYDSLVFNKGIRISERAERKESFANTAFGILKNSFGKGNSSAWVNKARKFWR